LALFQLGWILPLKVSEKVPFVRQQSKYQNCPPSQQFLLMMVAAVAAIVVNGRELLGLLSLCVKIHNNLTA